MAKKTNLEWRNCSEEQLHHHLKDWLNEEPLQNSILFLEGEMGAGKSTWVRALLSILNPELKSQGSPTFPLVQEYALPGRDAPLYHIDLYRLKSEGELQDSGLEAQIEEPGAVVCIEWGSMFSEFFAYWLDGSKKRRKKVFVIEMSAGEQLETRNYWMREI